MATNNFLTIFDSMPAHVKAAQQAGASNIVTRTQVNALTFPGKVWTVIIDGTKKPLTRTGADGEEELIQTFDAVIIAYNENRGRAYYGGRTYDPNAENAPVCWSNDGVTSSPNSSERQSEKCNVCPQSIKGSRQTDQGKPAAACAVHRNLAVIPRTKDLSTAPVLRLKIPQTSDFDGLNKEAQAKGMFAFTNYLNFLKSKNVPFTYSLTTKIRFDNTKSYPKLWFSPGRWLTDEEATACAEIAGGSTLDDLLKTDFSGFGNARPPGITEEDEAEDEDEVVTLTPVPATVTTAPVPAPAPAPAPKPPDPRGDLSKGPASTKNDKQTAASKKAEAAAAAAAARKNAVLEDDEDEVGPLRVVKMPAAERSPPIPAVAGSPALDQILTDWDDE